MMVVTNSTALHIPVELFGKMQQFLASGKTGKLTFHVKEGLIVGWNIDESGRVRGRELDSTTKNPLT